DPRHLGAEVGGRALDGGRHGAASRYSLKPWIDRRAPTEPAPVFIIITSAPFGAGISTGISRGISANSLMARWYSSMCATDAPTNTSWTFDRSTPAARSLRMMFLTAVRFGVGFIAAPPRREQTRRRATTSRPGRRRR